MAATRLFTAAIIAFTAATVALAAAFTAVAVALAVALAACAAFCEVLTVACAVFCAAFAVCWLVFIAAFAVCSAVLTDFCVVFAASFPANLIVFLPEEVVDCLIVFSAVSTVLIAELVFCAVCFLNDCSARCCLKRWKPSLAEWIFRLVSPTPFRPALSNACLPFVTASTFPPYFFIRAESHAVRCQR